MRRILLITLVANFWMNSSYAETMVTGIYCTPPREPLFLSPSHYHKQYDEDVKRYKECVANFIQEQDRAMKSHEQATEKLLEEMRTNKRRTRI